jgi:hypothetical protein
MPADLGELEARAFQDPLERLTHRERPAVTVHADILRKQARAEEDPDPCVVPKKSERLGRGRIQDPDPGGNLQVGARGLDVFLRPELGARDPGLLGSRR